MEHANEICTNIAEKDVILFIPSMKYGLRVKRNDAFQKLEEVFITCFNHKEWGLK